MPLRHSLFVAGLSLSVAAFGVPLQGARAGQNGAGAATPENVTPENAAPETVTPEAFRNPPPSDRPGTFYHWMNGNVTKAGLDADLQAMHDVGIGSVMVFDGSNDVPKGPVDYRSPAWLALMTHMMEKAQSLGITVGMHNAPGWSSSGGPWITPAQSMQQLVWTETTIAGGRRARLVLPRPYAKLGYYRDALILAYPASDGDDAVWKSAIASVRVGGAVADSILVVDRDLDTAVAIAPDKPLVITTGKPFTAAAVTLYGGREETAFSARIEASDDGEHWRTILELAVPIQHERGIEAPGSSNIRPATARYFRITPSRPVQLAEALFSATPRLDRWSDKAEYSYRVAQADDDAAIQPAAAGTIDPARVIDISDRVDAEGRLDWVAPAGRWTILRLGHTTTAHRNVAASDSGSGLEVDKFDRAAVDFQFDQTVGRVLQAAGPLAGNTFGQLMIDSYEAGMQNWTAKLPADFRQRNGYALTAYAPALTGRIVGSPAMSNRFLFDFRRTLADLMAENYYGRMQERARAAGLRFHVESYGPGPGDALTIAGEVDVPTSEFWARTPWTDNRTMKMVASAANVYGRSIVAAESFTGEAETSRWEDYPYSLKPLGDQMFALGLNHILFHRYAHQPDPNTYPGMVMGPWGINFERSNTWFAEARPWLDYLARSQYLLRQGHHQADVLYFIGEESPNQAEYVRPQVSPDSNPRIGEYFAPQVPAGYDYDLVDAKALLTRASVQDGRIVLPNGASYALLVLPDQLRAMTPRLLARIRQLVEEGAVILGPKPLRPLGMAGMADHDAAFRGDALALWGDGAAGAARAVGRGRVFTGSGVGDVLGRLGVGPDIVCRTQSPDGKIVWQHRNLGAKDLYFVANRQRKAEAVTCTFRRGNATPGFWDAESGTVSRPLLFQSTATATTVGFDLAPAGSLFVMLEPGATSEGVKWVARNGARIAGLDFGPPAPAPVADSFTQMLWAKPDIDLRLMPDATTEGRINETGKNYLINARSGIDLHGPGTAVAGLALGRNGAFVIERESPDRVPAVVVSHQPVSGWTHVALVYDKGVPSLYLDGRLAGTGRKSGRRVFAGGMDAPVATGATYFFEGNFTPLETRARALSASEIAAAAAKGPPPPAAPPRLALHRARDGRISGLAFESGDYTLDGGGAFRAAVPDPIAIAGPWTVRFQPGRGAPPAITLPRLQSLSRLDDPAVRHFAGTASYERTIDVPPGDLRPGRRLFLDLGRVEVLARVVVNGHDLGVVWKEPYRLDVTEALHPGRNELRVAVTSLWPNRLIGDAALPEEGTFVDAEWPVGERFLADGRKENIMARKITALPDWYRQGKAKPAGGRVTFAPWTFYAAGDPLLDSGLLGPVRLIFAEEVAVRGR